MKKIILIFLSISILLLGLAPISYINLYPHFVISFLIFFVWTIVVIKKWMPNRKKAILLLPGLFLLNIYVSGITDYGFQNALRGLLSPNVGMPAISGMLIAIFLGVWYCAGGVNKQISLIVFGSLLLGFGLFGSTIIERFRHFIGYKSFTGITLEKEPEWTAMRADSTFFDQNTYDNKILVLDFWFTACGACFEGFPVFDSLKKKYDNDSRFVFYSINYLLKDEKPTDNIRLIREKNYSFPVAFMGDSSIRAFNAGFPTVMIISKKQIRYRGSAQYAFAALEDFVRE